MNRSLSFESGGPCSLSRPLATQRDRSTELQPHRWAENGFEKTERSMSRITMPSMHLVISKIASALSPTRWAPNVSGQNWA
jgi:hypothetical protein